MGQAIFIKLGLLGVLVLILFGMEIGTDMSFSLRRTRLAPALTQDQAAAERAPSAARCQPSSYRSGLPGELP